MAGEVDVGVFELGVGQSVAEGVEGCVLCECEGMEGSSGFFVV